MIPRQFVPISIGVFVIVAALGLYPLALLIALLILTSEVARLWSRYSLARLEYTREFGQTRAIFGEEIDLAIRVVNRKILPLPWLEVDDQLPDSLPIVGHTLYPSSTPRHSLLSNLFSFGPYEQITRRYRLRCAARGYFAFGPAMFRSGDVFGFGSREHVDEHIDHLLVYPRVLPIAELGLPAKRPFGDTKAASRLFEDPTRIRSVRPFEFGDPLKRVNWKATARTGELQVKQFDPTASHDLLIVLNTATFEHSWQGVHIDLFETAICVTASVASHALAEGFPVGLHVNSTLPGSDQNIKLAPGRGNEQEPRILEALAKLSPFISMTLESHLRREQRALPWSSTIVVVSATATSELLTILLALRRNGHHVVFIGVGSEVPDQLPGLVTYRVPVMEDLSFKDEPEPALSIR
jgi:uncharacterized protein (DUF58 family)